MHLPNMLHEFSISPEAAWLEKRLATGRDEAATIPYHDGELTGHIWK